MESSTRSAEALRQGTGKHEGSEVGLIATHTNKDEVMGAILHANEQGHDVVVTHVESVEPEGVEIARMMGARMLRGDLSDEGRDPSAKTTPSATEANDVAQAIEFVDPSTADPLQSSGESSRRKADRDGIETGEKVERSSIVVGIPAYNEASSIANVAELAAEYGDSVLVVDDGSRDETANAARTAGATVIEHDYNRYGAALKTLFGAAEREGADHLVILDADDQHDSLDIPRLVSKQRESDADIVIGSRFVDGATTEFPLY